MYSITTVNLYRLWHSGSSVCECSYALGACVIGWVWVCLAAGMYCTHLERLDLSGVSVSQSSFRQLSQRCTKLKVRLSKYTRKWEPAIYSVCKDSTLISVAESQWMSHGWREVVCLVTIITFCHYFHGLSVVCVSPPVFWWGVVNAMADFRVLIYKELIAD